jgi:hypothetical protein
MDLQAMGRVGLTGVKGKMGRRVAGAVAKRTGIDEDRLAAILGGALLALWCYQTLKTVRAVVEAARGSDRPDLAAA